MFALKSMFLWKHILTFTGIDHSLVKAREGGMLCSLGSKTIKIKSEKGELKNRLAGGTKYSADKDLWESAFTKKKKQN